jgi:adenylosuccinate synthase
MARLALIGGQWGDEGKAKVASLFASAADNFVRFNGGGNAGHTYYHEGQKIVGHLVPCGAPFSHVTNYIGNGCVINPVALLEEIRALEDLGYTDIRRRLRISPLAHITWPWHLGADSGALGTISGTVQTTQKGVGPTYGDKVCRMGLRFADIIPETPENDWQIDGVRRLSAQQVADAMEWFFALAELRPLVHDTRAELLSLIRKGSTVLFEGAQGTLLDVDHGTYPFVTSSNCTIGGVFTGTGLPPTCVDHVMLVIKAYITRVGAGPFPTKAEARFAEFLQKQGNEFGSTTGRPRDCGYLDLPALRYACQVNGAHSLAVTKIDVFDQWREHIPICTHYMVDGRKLEVWDPAVPMERCVPVYAQLPGWAASCKNAREWEDLPRRAQDYLYFIGQETAVPISLVSVGPLPDQSIFMDECPFDRRLANK